MDGAAIALFICLKDIGLVYKYPLGLNNGAICRHNKRDYTHIFNEFTALLVSCLLIPCL